jgi:hypothetical protein
MINMKLDEYTGSYTVAERKKNDALNSLVASNRLIILPVAKKLLKLYMAIIPKVCNGSTENIVSQDFEKNASNVSEIETTNLDDIQSNTMCTGLAEPSSFEHSSELLGEKQKVRVIKKAFEKPTALQIFLRPTTQECLNTFGYVTVGQKIVTIPSNTDERPGEAMMSASREILLSKTDKRSRPRATGNYMSYDTDFPDFIFNFVFNHMYL